MLLFDLEIAFDSIWIKGHIHKLIIIHSQPYLVNNIRFYFRNRKFTLKTIITQLEQNLLESHKDHFLDPYCLTCTHTT